MGASTSVRWHVHKDREPRNDFERATPWLVDANGTRIRRVASQRAALELVVDWYRTTGGAGNPALPQVLRRWGL